MRNPWSTLGAENSSGVMAPGNVQTEHVAERETHLLLSGIRAGNPMACDTTSPPPIPTPLLLRLSFNNNLTRQERYRGGELGSQRVRTCTFSTVSFTCPCPVWVLKMQLIMTRLQNQRIPKDPITR